MIKEIPAHLLRPRVLTRCQNPSSPAKIAQRWHINPIIFFAPWIFVSREQEGSGQMEYRRGEAFSSTVGWKAWSVWKPRISRRSQHGVVFCSQILFFSATVAFRTNFLPLADFKSDLSRTNLKLPSGQLGPQSPQMFSLWTGHWSNFPFLAIFFPKQRACSQATDVCLQALPLSLPSPRDFFRSPPGITLSPNREPIHRLCHVRVS